MRSVWDILRDLFWHPCPNCKNWTTEIYERAVNRFGENNNTPYDKKLYHCFECGVWFRER